MQNIELSKEQKKLAISEIKRFFFEEREENLSDFNAEILLDFIITKVGSVIYNQAIADVQKVMSEKVEDLFALMK